MMNFRTLIFLFTLFPLASLGAEEEGIASFYGPGFHGKETASGEVYNQNDLTAAHRTHRFGTLLEVTNLANGRTVQVRVNDRGPFVEGRLLDLSVEAARQLGFGLQEGLARIRVKVLSGGTVSGEHPVEGQFWIQVGSYRTEANAVAQSRRLTNLGLTPRIRLGDFYRVFLGPFDLEARDRVVQNLKSQGFSSQIRSTPPDGYEKLHSNP